jgi:RimJ/RimL family protein N-acetyltransferase
MQIQTERLLLREFVIGDWQAVYVYQSDPRYLQLYEWENRTESDVRAFVQRFVNWQIERPRAKYQLALTLNGQLIGNCGVRFENVAHRVAEMGYELAPDFWRNGYATEAARAMLNLGFGELNAHRIQAWCIAQNTASAHVLEKLGFKLEGHVREQRWFKGRWWDALVYGLLEEEWRAHS